MKHLLNVMLASLAFCNLDSRLCVFLQPAASRCLSEERRGVRGGPRSGQRAAVALSVLLVRPEQPSR